MRVSINGTVFVIRFAVERADSAATPFYEVSRHDTREEAIDAVPNDRGSYRVIPVRD